MQTQCLHCGKHFTARRHTARFCSGAHRLAAHRRSPISGPARAPTVALDAFISVTGTQDTHSRDRGNNQGDVTLTTQQPRGLDRRIVPDAKWPGMYRIRRPDGSLTDMVNLTRAKEALLRV
jgi:hypothetical protein